MFLFVLGCATSQQSRTQEKPPGFIGRLFDNTVSRYNAFYNSNLVYETSISAAKDGYREDYDSLFTPSVQDEVARNGSVSGQMDEIIKKTTVMIEKKPYSKWVDDHFLLNGIAHYIKGDYEMAERIFRYVSSEYKAGVQDERVTARQKIKGVELAKQRKEAAKEKLKEIEKQREERLKEYEKARKEREREAKSRARRAKNIKKRNKRLKKAAEREAAERRKAGLDVNAKEIVRDIKSQERKEKQEREKISDKDREILAKAPTLQNDESFQKEGLLAHELAAKDALLWLAKTYITTEQFLAANAILTAINEDEYFPSRLNTDYYLTYADMHIRLDNKPKAIEYVQLAAESAKKKNKGRMYYLIGQLYSDLGQWDKAEEAFNTVQKFHPHYDMIYHAKINNIERAFSIGQFETNDYVTPLKRMTKDAKNDEFLDEVFYYLGEAYYAKGQKEDAIEAFQKSIEYQKDNKEINLRTYLALGHQFYQDRQFKKAQPNFAKALEFISENSPKHATTSLYADNLKEVNKSLAQIHIQDSLLDLAKLPDDELLKFIEKKVRKEIRDEFKEKLEEENATFGNATSQTNNRNNRRSRNNVSESDAFYFYDLQQSISGYSEFKQQWGNRPNVDNWRLSYRVDVMRNRARGAQKSKFEEQEVSSEQERIAEYLAQVPTTSQLKEKAQTSIYDAYLNLIDIFKNSFGDDEFSQYYEEALAKRNPTAEVIEQLHAITNPSATSVNTSTPAATKLSEVELMYNQVYEFYIAEKYDKAIAVANQSKNFKNNDFEDKFAFILAMSKGKKEGNDALKSELKNFVKSYPRSSLKDQALQLINQ